EDEDVISREAMEEIAREIAGSMGENPAASDVDSIDAGEMPVNDEMIDGVSRPEGYEENVPGDMGLSEEPPVEEAPDLNEVLQTGLDAHADAISREKCVQMVSEALESFKASKDILE